MLRAEIFNGFLSCAFKSSRTGDEFIFRRDIYVECLAIAGHIKNILGKYRVLADHTDIRGPLREDECIHLVVLLDYTAVGRASCGCELDGQIQTCDPRGKMVVGSEQVRFCGVLGSANFAPGHLDLSAHRATVGKGSEYRQRD